MATRSTSSQTPEAAASTPFQGLGAGLDFFKDWMQAASSGLPNFIQAASQTPSGSAPSWMLPTLDADELEKRLHDLRAVKFWLEQNTHMVSMTIQTLEVQRMTLETLKGMNVPLDAVKDSLKARAETGAANPMAWWETLSQQFADMTRQAAAEGGKAGRAAASGAADAAPSKATGQPAAPSRSAKPKTSVKGNTRSAR